MENVKQSQEALILKDLKEGKKITTLNALYNYGCARLSARIFNLKAKGHNIKGELIPIKTRVGIKHVTQYSL